MAFRGLSIVLGAGFLAFLISAYGLEAARFSPMAVTALRVLAWGVVILLTFLFLVRPLVRRVSDQQVALYLEEQEPSLEAAILGALTADEGEGNRGRGPSAALLDRLVERAVERARAVDYGRRIDRGGLYKGSGALAAIAVAIVLFLLLAPKGVRYGMTALVLPTTEAAEVNPYSIAVWPGDATVARGSDQLVTAELAGFDSEEVSLFSRVAADEPYRRISMFPADSGRHELLLLNLLDVTEYFVEADGVRSPTFTIEVEDLPYVQVMTHRYVFPAYTGLEPRDVSPAGDIAGLAGTRVEVSVQPTIPTSGGLILVDDSVAFELTPTGEGNLEGEIPVRREGVYRIRLGASGGQLVDASPEYTIDVLEDLAPTVVITDPGRDSQASAIEEVFIEAKADDDFGIQELYLVYSINGGSGDTIPLFSAAGSPSPEVTAGHTLFLEEWGLATGDVISYYAVTRDNREGQGVEALSDIYFVTVRPFRREYRQADEQPGSAGQQPPGGAGAGGMEQGGSLSELQREVVAATFNLLRDQDTYSPQELSENLVSVALAQGRVRDEVANLLVQMNTRGVSDANPHFQEIAELLPVAIQDMEAAEGLLRDERAGDALPPEQRALQFLLKAEETYERVVQQQQGGGGGGGGGGASAEELADLFEMELDKLQNQYETVQRGERQQADAEVDALMERLKELARRQQQELERQRVRSDAQQGGGGGGSGQSQRDLAEEAEEAARQLEELSRRTGDQQLAETARRLRDAAETMRRSAASSGQSQGVAEATSALDDLEEARRRLERNQESRMDDGIQDALDRVDRLAQDQERVREEVENLPEDPGGRREGVQEIHEQKDQMVRDAQALERDLYRMQQAVQRENQEAAAELGDAVEAIREGKLKETLAYTKGVVEQRDREQALEWEDQIATGIQDLREEVESALSAFREGVPDRNLEEALEETRELVRGAESLGRRLEGQGRRGESGDQAARSREESGDPAVEGQGGEAGGEPGQQSGDQRSRQSEDQRGEASSGEGGDSSGQQAEGRAGEQAGGQSGQRTGDQVGQGQGGQGETNRNAQDADARTEGSPFGGATRGDPRPFTAEEIRQFSREFGQRLRDARELQERLRETGRELPELEEAIEAFQVLEDPDSYGDLPQIERLQAEVRENLKRLEFILRREVEEEDTARAALTGTEDVPSGFREMVDEYFRNLARTGSGGTGGG
jgi:hypothetical protein